MTTKHVVSDEQLGQLARRQYDLFRRVREGTLPVELVLVGLQDLTEGNFDAIPAGPRRLIDCDALPYIPDGWAIESHKKGGQIEFDPSKIVFHLEERQKTGTVVGNELRKALEGKPVLNACVLDHLLANTGQIPESWKYDENGNTRYTYFWGTIYRNSDGSLYVRCLYWGGGRWCWYGSYLDSDFGSQRPALLLAR